jgi:hypothetical protein
VPAARAALFEQARDVDKAETRPIRIRNEAVREIVVARNTPKTNLPAYNASTAHVAAGIPSRGYCAQAAISSLDATVESVLSR